MAKQTALSNIAITHISLVKAGANGKEVIYKSAKPGNYENTIDIKKVDDEQGVVYGVVYAPEEVDTQGDFATAEEIKKAAYGFMKSLNGRNVDVEHSFQNEAAFVAESWIVKGGDSIFPNEPEGSWAVAIQLESDELKTLAKSGELAGLSMAGEATKTEVEKAEGAGEQAFSNFFKAFADVASDIWIDFGGLIKKSKGNDMAEKLDEAAQSFSEIVKEKLEKATRGATEGLKKQDDKIAALQTSATEMAEKFDALEKAHQTATEENATLKTENEVLQKTLGEQAAALEALEKTTTDLSASVKESKQKNTLKKTTPKDDTKGTL